MGRKRVKVELHDRRGRKVTLAMEGDFDVRKVKQMVELLDLATSGDVTVPEPEPATTESTKEQLLLIVGEAGTRWLTSRELSRAYFDRFGTPVIPAVASTYLGRLYRDGLLERRGPRRRMAYRLKERPRVDSLA